MAAPFLTLAKISIQSNPTVLDSPLDMVLSFLEPVSPDTQVSVILVLDAAVNKQEIVIMPRGAVALDSSSNMVILKSGCINLEGVQKRILKNVAMISVSFHLPTGGSVQTELVCAVEERDGVLYRTVFSPLE